MELLSMEVHGGQVGVGDTDLRGVLAVIETGVDLEAGGGRGRAVEVDDRLPRDQRLPAPVHRDVREQAVLDPVPLRRSRRQVADVDLKPGLLREGLQLDLPQSDAVAVGPAAVGGDLQAGGVRVAHLAEVLPPPADRVDRELRSVVIDPDVHPALIRGDVIDAIRARFTELLVLEVVHADQLGLALGAPFPPGVLEIADQLLLFAVDRDDRLTVLQRLAAGRVDPPELQITIGMLAALTGLHVRLQAVPSGTQQLRDRHVLDLMTELAQPTSKMAHTLRCPQQQRLRITTTILVHQPLQIDQQPRIALAQRPAPTTRPTAVSYTHLRAHE